MLKKDKDIHLMHHNNRKKESLMKVKYENGDMKC